MQGFTYYVDTLDFDVPWNLISGTFWRPPISVRQAQTDIPGRHGTFASTAYTLFDTATLTLVFGIQPTAGVTLEAAMNNLIGVFVKPGDINITRYSEGLTTSAKCRLVNISQPDQFFVGRVASATVQLTVPGVFWREAQVTVGPTVVQNSGTIDYPELSGGTAPITDAVVMVKGPFTEFEIFDDATNTGLIYTGNVTSTEYLYLDARQLTARKSSVSGQWIGGGTDVTGGLDYPVAGPLALWPTNDPATPLQRLTRVRVNGQGRTGATSMSIYAQKAYL